MAAAQSDGSARNALTEAFATKSFSQSENQAESPQLTRLKGAAQANPAPFAALSTSDRSAIVAYAYKWAMARNPDFKALDDDCTSFASQALFAGGWQQEIGWPTDQGAWFGGTLLMANAWSRAQSLFDFGYQVTGRFHYAQDAPSAGDITFWIWRKGDGTYNYTFDHTSIVTFTDSTGQPYYTQHTNDHVNKSLTLMLADEPGAIYSNWGV
ncbi:amidase domain-containing protein [Cryobacterium sp. 10I1]|uniref:amidase domain-containing protein n=1 Tax=unclassified Cryobacterium TaxID=2649013 RepID=UPI002B230DE0|nr:MULTISPECIES: amidase domain-containing protein [unclassified Cryobacterium]MEB0003819.1 amidase domain-containing protein [Cryobacterium sp. RTC2.1]MEB0305471.1 amidase domain-containing protein [Cryobacterium sp. 10I1]